MSTDPRSGLRTLTKFDAEGDRYDLVLDDSRDRKQRPAVTAEMIERYKAEWKAHGFPDMEYGVTRAGQGTLANDSPATLTPEHWLWIGVILDAIGCIRGTDPTWHKTCKACWFSNGFEHTNQRCAIAWVDCLDFAGVCNMLGLEYTYMRRKIFGKGRCNVRTN